MTIASCPSCHEQVTLPAGAGPDAIVRCPLCQEQFALREFLSQLPPELIVVESRQPEPDSASAWAFPPDRSPEPAESETSDSNVLGTGSWHPGTESESDDHGADSQTDGGDEALPFDFTPGSAPQASVVLEPAPRAPRARKKPAVELAKIVAGGLLAIPLALLILLWLPGRWQRDPLRIGPSIGRVVPWLVPANCRPLSSDSSSRRTDISDANARVERRRPAPSRAPSSARPNGTSTERAGGVPAPAHASNRQAASRPEPASENPRAPSAHARSSTPAPVKPDPNKKSSAAAKATAPQTSGGDRSGDNTRGNGPRTGKELRAALVAADRANDAWDARGTANATTESKLTDQLYGTFAQLGDVITFVNPQDEGVRDSIGAVQSLLMSLAMRPKKLAALGNRAAQWLDEKQRGSEGILLFGTVKKIHAVGQLFAMDLELAARRRRTVSVVSRVDPKSVCKPRDRVLVLGAIIRDPATNLAGYAGSQPLVVMAGFPPVAIGR